jgi:plasmid stabilization system protein ParE
MADHDANQAYVSERSPSGSDRLWLRITERDEQLREFPLAAPAVEGRPGLRIMAITGTPYLVLYSVKTEAIRIEAVMHGARKKDVGRLIRARAAVGGGLREISSPPLLCRQ